MDGREEVSLQIEELNNVVAPNDPVVTNVEAALNDRLTQFQQSTQVQELRGTHNSNPAMCMYKVPPSLIDISPKAIDPEKVSIGPYHRGKPHLSDFDNCKVQSLANLLSRTRIDKRVFIIAATVMEERARRCYDNSQDTITSMSIPDFVAMMVLDGCFIIELFRPGGSNVFSTPAGLLSVITGDLLKLENQLPFFVLQKLFELSTGVEEDPLALQLLALKFFHVSFPMPTEEVLSRSTQRPEHLLHLFHASSSSVLERRAPPFIYQKFMSIHQKFMSIHQKLMRDLGRGPIKFMKSFPTTIFLISCSILNAINFPFYMLFNFPYLWWCHLLLTMFFQPNNQLREFRPSSESIQCASKLRTSWVTFKPLRAESLLVISFKYLVLQIPAIAIDELTITVFVNCIALEQASDQNPTIRSLFTTYIAFMSCLIDSSKDVACLSSDGIITSSFSYNDQAVADLIKKFGEKVNFDKGDCYLSQQFKDMEAYCNSPIGSFIRIYFSSPWSFLSVLSACLLIFLTVVQTHLSVLTYFHTPSKS